MPSRTCGGVPRCAFRHLTTQPEVAFYPNTDLTAHLFREPVGEWLGFSTHVCYGPRGAGVTHSVVHDELGPFGTLAQMLTVRPRT